jgi:branched-chain amino acid transport system permease protein
MLIADITSEFVMQNCVNALALGSLYALFALGIALIFGIMRLINFAHGELIMVGAYILTLAAAQPAILKLAMALVGVIVLALLMDRVAFRPVRDANPATLLVTSFAVSYLLQNTAILVVGAAPRTTNLSTTLSESMTVAGVDIPKLNIVAVVLTAVIVVGLVVFLRRTRLGVEMRAAAEDFEMTRLLGIRANRVIATAFGLSGALAGVAAILLVAQTGVVSPTMGVNAVLFAFIATIVGGMGSLGGAVVCGYIVGAVTVLLQAFLPLSLRSTATLWCSDLSSYCSFFGLRELCLAGH